MNNDKAQSLSPSYMRLPDDGAEYRCHVCGKLKPHTEVIKPFTPDGKVHYAQCLDCTDPGWMDEAVDCGVAE